MYGYLRHILWANPWKLTHHTHMRPLTKIVFGKGHNKNWELLTIEIFLIEIVFGRGEDVSPASPRLHITINLFSERPIVGDTLGITLFCLTLSGVLEECCVSDFKVWIRLHADDVFPVSKSWGHQSLRLRFGTKTRWLLTKFIISKLTLNDEVHCVAIARRKAKTFQRVHTFGNRPNTACAVFLGISVAG